MQTETVARPRQGEYNPYYGRYIELVPDGDIVQLLDAQLGDTLAFLRGIASDRSLHRYAEGKWSIRDVVQHLSDAERIFAYRALRVARGDATPLPSFDENAYAPAANADRRDWRAIVDEFESVRHATTALFAGLTPEMMARTGTASGHVISARALAWITAGHERHHVTILRERYL